MKDHVKTADKNMCIKVPFELDLMIEKFQANYWVEFGHKITKQKLIHLALETYITKAYELSTDK